MLILLSGPVGSGKTTLCQRLAEWARLRGLAVGGVLTPALFRDESKVGIEAVDLCSGEVRLLARGHALDGHKDRGVAEDGCGPGKTRVGQYLLDDSVLEWMASLCEKALTAPREAAAKSLVFVDEIGRLELNRGGGLACLVPLLAERRARCAIAIVRDSLLDRLVARVQAADPHVVKLDAGRREKAWQETVQLVLESSL